MTGFCMGGALAIATSVLVEGISAVSSFYGICSKELADVSKATIPLQAHFGEKDNVTGFSDVQVG